MGFHAKGAQLQIGDGAPTEVFTPVVEMQSISFGGITTPTVESTNHDSSWAEYLAGIPDGGSVNFSGNFVPGDGTHDNVTGLISKLGSFSNYKVVSPDASAWTVEFSAILTIDSIEFPHDGKGSISGTLKINGAPTFS